ncbi:MAG TPA: CDP-alcohol phosphatidyltransferase family protein [Chthoniobacterales bacterium]|jgi:phosphatidylglycerophosphate synthase
MESNAESHGDRRPIATRRRKWAQASAAWLAQQNVSPNAISIVGMCACIAAGILLALTSAVYCPLEWLAAAVLVQLRLTANMLDGMVALNSGRTSRVGELYNEIPDRVSDAAVFVGAGFAFSGNATLGYVATVVSIFTAYVRAAGKIAGAPSEFCGPMAKQHRMLVITMTGVYATVAPRSWLLIHVGQKAVGVMSIGLAIIVIGCVVTVFRRLKRIAAALS